LVLDSSLTECAEILRIPNPKPTDVRNCLKQFSSGQLNAPKIYFNAWRSSSFGNTKNTVTYDDVTGDSSTINKSTGIFTAPVDGTFFFSFNMLHISVSDDAEARVFLLRNGNIQTTGYCGHDLCPISMSRILELKKGDTVAVKLDVGHVYDTTERFTNFIGFQLR
jgi:C1q domain